MSESEDKDSKTEEPTEKKIRDTVEKGKLPHSREAALLSSFVAILVYAVFIAQDNIVGFSQFLAIFLERPDAWQLDTGQDAVALMRLVGVETGRMIGSVLLLLIVAGIGASVFQHLPQFVGERIRPQWSRVSPAGGWKRLFGAQGLVEFVKSVAKLVFVLAVLAFLVNGARDQLLSGMITHPAAFGMVIHGVTVQMLSAITLVMLAIAVADLAWQRFHWRSELRMSRQEVKDEMKQAEGDPIMKARLRSLARDRARQRMITAVPKATLVIANPTHYAIALRYERDVDAAPTVLAKGTDLVALKIREIAEANGVPVFEDVALARSMYKQVSVDSMIPAQFYQAVAELVKIVYAKRPQERRTNG